MQGRATDRKSKNHNEKIQKFLNPVSKEGNSVRSSVFSNYRQNERSQTRGVDPSTFDDENVEEEEVNYDDIDSDFHAMKQNLNSAST